MLRSLLCALRCWPACAALVAGTAALAQCAPAAAVGHMATVPGVAVPDIAGKNQDEARRMLANCGLQAAFSPDGSGLAVSTRPEQGSRVNAHSTVRVLMRQGSAPPPPPVDQVQVPAVAGLSQGEIEEQMRVRSLVPSFSPDGNGIGDFSAPAVGTPVAHGSTVVVSMKRLQAPPPPPAVGARIPDVAGMARDDARMRLAQAGFKVSFRTKGQTVAYTLPRAGDKAVEGSLVAVFLEAAILHTVSVPSLVGLTRAQAVERLKESQLTAGAIRGEDAARVTGQSPDAGEQVAAGSAVSFMLAAATPWGAIAGWTGGVALAGGVAALMLRWRREDTTPNHQHSEVTPAAAVSLAIAESSGMGQTRVRAEPQVRLTVTLRDTGPRPQYAVRGPVVGRRVDETGGDGHGQR